MKKLTPKQVELIDALDGHADVKVSGKLKDSCIRLAHRGFVKMKTRVFFFGGKMHPESFVTVTAAGRKARASWA